MSVFVLCFVGLIIGGEAAFGIISLTRHAASMRPLWPAALTPLFAIVLLGGTFAYERSVTSKILISENVLILGRKKFPLAGLTGIERDPEVMKRAVKLFGNGGLGSIRGRYWSTRMGRFYAFLTGTENAVVLRWPKAVVAVSPADTEFFIHSVREATGVQ